MAIIDRDEFLALANHQEPFSVSIFMPENLDGREIRQDPIRLKNLLLDAEEMMVDAGMRSSEARDRLDIARRNLLDNAEFWRHVKGGLAVFIDASGAQWYRVPFPMRDLVIVNERFHLKPLVCLISDEMRFYMLAMSQEAVRLFRCGRYDFDEVPLHGLPKDFGEFLNVFESSKQVQSHAGGGTRESGIFHGQGTTNDKAVQKKRLFEYCQMIDGAVQRRLARERAPLVLAAAEPMVGVYRQASRYSGLHRAVVEGNPDLVPLADLHGGAVAALAEAFASERQGAVNALMEVYGGPRASDDLERVVLAADEGQVETIFVSADRQCWGEYDRQERRVNRHEKCQAGDMDLLDFAACRTLCNGGKAYVLPVDQMPVGSDIAAIFRYAPVTSR